MLFDFFAFNPAPTQELRQYGKYLLTRLDEAIHVPKVAVASDDFTPTPNNCHLNCAQWALRNDGHKIALGWWVMDQRQMLGHVRFFAHSVMADPDLQFYDITPGKQLEQYGFLASNLKSDDYQRMEQALIDAYGVSMLDAR